MTTSNTQLKHRFLDAVLDGKLGTLTERGYVVSLKEFRLYFSDIRTQYSSSFLPASVIEIGQLSITHTKFVFRVKKGMYLVHPDALVEHKLLRDNEIREVSVAYMVA